MSRRDAGLAPTMRIAPLELTARVVEDPDVPLFDSKGVPVLCFVAFGKILVHPKRMDEFLLNLTSPSIARDPELRQLLFGDE